MTIEEQANIARDMTGSKISTTDLVNGVNNLDKATKKQIYLKVANILNGNKVPFDKAFPIAREQINKIADSYNIDPAVLFWACMELRK